MGMLSIPRPGQRHCSSQMAINAITPAPRLARDGRSSMLPAPHFSSGGISILAGCGSQIPMPPSSRRRSSRLRCMPSTSGRSTSAAFSMSSTSKIASDSAMERLRSTSNAAKSDSCWSSPRPPARCTTTCWPFRFLQIGWHGSATAIHAASNIDSPVIPTVE